MKINKKFSKKFQDGGLTRGMEQAGSDWLDKAFARARAKAGLPPHSGQKTTKISDLDVDTFLKQNKPKTEMEKYRQLKGLKDAETKKLGTLLRRQVQRRPDFHHTHKPLKPSDNELLRMLKSNAGRALLKKAGWLSLAYLAYEKIRGAKKRTDKGKDK